MKKRSLAWLAILPLAAACAQTAEDAGEAAPDAQSGESDGASTEPLTLDTSVPEGDTLVQATGAEGEGFGTDCIVGEDGISGIGMPATLGDFAAAFPASVALRFEANFMVDFGALCALSGGEDAVCAIFESYDTPAYDPEKTVGGLAVYAPQCRTADGIGPGSSIEDAEAAYGDAVFSFNYANEGREYLAFEHGPANMSFRAEADTPAPEEPGWPAGRSAGDYADVNSDGGEYYETGAFRAGARIWEIWVSAPGD